MRFVYIISTFLSFISIESTEGKRTDRSANKNSLSQYTAHIAIIFTGLTTDQGWIQTRGGYRPGADADRM